MTESEPAPRDERPEGRGRADPQPSNELDESALEALDYALPPGCIAQQPAARRDDARLLVLERDSGARRHSGVRELADWLDPGDLLVVNATRVLPARLRGHKHSGGAAESLLLGPADEAGHYRALLRCGGHARPGLGLVFRGRGRTLESRVVRVGERGEVVLAFDPSESPYALGEAPLPPYIRRSEALAEDDERYQTLFARVPGSVAAPTAGLHLSRELLAALDARGVARVEVVLHVGAGTFRPVEAQDLRRHRLHAEHFELPDAVADAVAATRERGGRVVAVGTTSARVLESCARDDGGVDARRGETELFLAPGDPFRVVDALLTNFHLPRSSLLMLVAAFAGREAVLAAYADAIARGYRFYSYGDAMLVR